MKLEQIGQLVTQIGALLIWGTLLAFFLFLAWAFFG
jgi:hypothetical protein